MVVTMLIVDGHEDIAYNTLVDGRDFLSSALAVRAAEAHDSFQSFNGDCMLGLPDLLEGGVAVVFATLLTIPRSETFKGEPGYPNPEAAHQIAMAQLGIYRRWAAADSRVSLILDQEDLGGVLASWASYPDDGSDTRRVGMVLLIENADAIRSPDEVAFWYEQGVRLIGPAWHSNRYTGSTIDGGPLTAAGRQLLDEMERVGMALDLSHMSEQACDEALARYDGPIVATHANPRRMVPMERLLSDATIGRLVERDGIVGIMPLAWALDPSWKEHRNRANVSLDAVVDAIDIVCQIAGDARHAGIGTDFDGGQGAEAAPSELDTVADLPKLADHLARRGYDQDDVTAIMGGNWLGFLRQHLPAHAIP